MHKAVSRLASASKVKKSTLLLRRSVISQCTNRNISNPPAEEENENEDKFKDETELANDPKMGIDVDTESFLKRAQAEVSKKSNIHETMKVKSLFDPSMSVVDKRESVLRMIEQIALAAQAEPNPEEKDAFEEALGYRQKVTQDDMTKAEATIRKLGFEKGFDDLQKALADTLLPDHPGADLTKVLEIKAGATILKAIDEQRKQGVQVNVDETIDLSKFRALKDYQELDEDEKKFAEEQVVDIVQKLRKSVSQAEKELASDMEVYTKQQQQLELDAIDEKAEDDAEKVFGVPELDVLKQFKHLEDELRPQYSNNQERLHEVKSEKLAKLERDLNAAADKIRNQYAGGNPQGSKLNLQPGIAITDHLEKKEDANRAVLFADQEVLQESIEKRRNGEPLHPYEYDAVDQALKRFQLREATWTAEVAMQKFKDDTNVKGFALKAGGSDVEQALAQARVKASETLQGPAYVAPSLHKMPKPYEHAGWKAVAEQMAKEDPRLWNEDKMKQLWGAIDGEVLADKQAFYDRLSEIGGKSEVVNRIRAFFPGFTPGAAEAVADKMIQFLVSSKPDRVPDSIQAVTNRLDEDRENFYEFSHFLTSPRPKMAAIYSSLDKLAKGSNSLEQFKTVAENFVQRDPRLSDNPIEVLYHNLAPLHSGLASSSTKKKQHEPQIYNGTTRARGTRKAALANVSLTPGNGLILINGRSYIDYFDGNDLKIYNMAIPLEVLGVTRQFDVKVHVKGGGPTGQSEAIQLAISRALSKFHPEYRSVLRKLGYLTVDTRVVERKKPGQKKARRKFQWVKR